MRRISFLLAILAACLIAVRPAAAAGFTINGDIVGAVSDYTVRKGDTYYSIARRHDLAVLALLAANPEVDPETAGPGTVLKLPGMHVLPDEPRRGIVINLAELRLYYFPTPDTVMTFPLGTGKDGWETQTGTTKIVEKQKDPVWIPPPSILAEEPGLPARIEPGPDDPLGAYALLLGWPNYAIHGTNAPKSIGLRVSHGCIRLYPEDIETLFSAVETGAPVTVIDSFFKLGWLNDRLYLEVSPTQAQALAIAKLEKPDPANIADLYAAVRWQERKGIRIDWPSVEKAALRHDGIPAAIAQRTPVVY